MMYKHTDTTLPQCNVPAKRVDSLQICYLVEPLSMDNVAGLVASAAGSNATAEEHSHAADGKTDYAQVWEQKQASEVHLSATTQPCAHEDVQLLCDLQSSFREAVQESSRHKPTPALPQTTNSCNVDVSGVLSSPRNPVTSSTSTYAHRSSLYHQRTAPSKLKPLPDSSRTGLSHLHSTAPGKGVVRIRSLLGYADIDTDADMTLHLRRMFSKAIKRKQRMMSVLPKVVEATMEDFLN